MNDVIDFESRRPKEPTLTGEVKCLSCRHTWIAVRPVGVVWLECPACHLEMGRAMGACNIEGLHWHCKCGNDLFYVMVDHMYCPVCGTEHDKN